MPEYQPVSRQESEENGECQVTSFTNSAFNVFNGNKKRKRMLNVFDSFISILIVGPCVIGGWRGIWILIEIYFPPVETALAGMGIHLIFAFAQNALHTVFVSDRDTTLWKMFVIAFSRLYTYVFHVAVILNWVGLWTLYDQFFELQLAGGVVVAGKYVDQTIATFVMTAVLVAMRSFKNVGAPPFVIYLDQIREYFKFPTYYKTDVSKSLT